MDLVNDLPEEERATYLDNADKRLAELNPWMSAYVIPDTTEGAS